jgi:hypothetical protein
LLSGKNIPKATKTPIIAPEAPTISELKDDIKLNKLPSPNTPDHAVLYFP